MTENIKVKIKAIDATLPTDNYILHWERLSKRGEVPEGDNIKCTINYWLDKIIWDQLHVCTTQNTTTEIEGLAYIY